MNTIGNLIGFKQRIICMEPTKFIFALHIGNFKHYKFMIKDATRMVNKAITQLLPSASKMVNKVIMQLFLFKRARE